MYRGNILSALSIVGQKRDLLTLVIMIEKLQISFPPSCIDISRRKPLLTTIKENGKFLTLEISKKETLASNL